MMNLKKFKTQMIISSLTLALEGKTSRFADSAVAMEPEDVDMIASYPETLVMNLFHADPANAAAAALLNDARDVDYDAADALGTETDLSVIWAEIMNPTSWDALASLAVNPLTPASVLADIVVLAYGADYDFSATYYAMQHPNLPTILLDWAVTDGAGANAAQGAAYSPNLTVAQQKSLSRCPILDVMEALAINPSTEGLIREGLLRRITARSPHFIDLLPQRQAGLLFTRAERSRHLSAA